MIRFHHHGESLRLQLLQPGAPAILNEELIATGIADAGHRRWRKDNDKRFWNFGANTRIHLCQNRGQSLFGRFTLREFLEGEEDRGGIGLITAEKIKAGEFNRVEHTGSLAPDLCNLIDDGLRAIERCGVGQLGVSDSVTAILCWQKTARHNFEPQTCKRK